MEKYNNFYRVAHDFHRRWAPAPANDEEWDEAAEDLNHTANRNGNDPFLMDMLTAIFTELERNYPPINHIGR